MNFKKRVNGSWTDTSHYIHNTSTDIITTLPAVIYPTGTTATVGLKGQTTQSSIPSPTSPVMPQGTGERTGNLAYAVEQGGITNTGDKTTNNVRVRVKAKVEPNTTYTFVSNALIVIISGFSGETFNDTIASPAPTTQYTFTTGAFDTDIYVTLRNADGTTIRPTDLSNVMLNTGSSPLPYEPWGIKIPISSANTTTPVYLGEVETTRKIKKLVLTGEESWSENVSGTNTFRGTMPLAENNMNYAPGFCTHVEYVTTGVSRDMELVGCLNSNIYLRLSRAIVNTLAGFKTYLQQQYAAGTPVTVWYVLAEPQTGIVNEPLRKIGDYADEVSGISIPTIAGANTLSVDTTLQPSEFTATWTGWHNASVKEWDGSQWNE